MVIYPLGGAGEKGCSQVPENASKKFVSTPDEYYSCDQSFGIWIEMVCARLHYGLTRERGYCVAQLIQIEEFHLEHPLEATGERAVGLVTKAVWGDAGRALAQTRVVGGMAEIPVLPDGR